MFVTEAMEGERWLRMLPDSSQPDGDSPKAAIGGQYATFIGVK